jgi:isopenicillin-N epimerase
VLEAQRQIQTQMERDPVRFFLRDFPPQLAAARTSLAEFLACAPDDLAFVPSATTGVNSVLRSLRLSPGDDLLITDHEYNACRNVAEYVAHERGCRVVIARLPFPLDGPSQIIESVLEALTPRTRLAMLDHVTSSSGLVLPIAQIAAKLKARGVPLLVDGAHAPGMIPLELDALDVAYYTGNCHKWLCAPKGAGFLWVHRDLQKSVRPAIISHGANAPTTHRSRFRSEFDWTGTRDPSAYLAVPEAIQFMGELLPGGWRALMDQNRALALEARQILSEALGITPPCPAEMIGSLVSLPLPAAPAADTGSAGSALNRDPLQEALFHRHAIEAVVAKGPGPTGRLLRISAQIYNAREEYEYLARALTEELSDRKLTNS